MPLVLRHRPLINQFSKKLVSEIGIGANKEGEERLHDTYGKHCEIQHHQSVRCNDVVV